MDVGALVVRDGDRVRASGCLVRNSQGDWFQPNLPVAGPGGLERRVRSVWQAGAIPVNGDGQAHMAARLVRVLPEIAAWAATLPLGILLLEPWLMPLRAIDHGGHARPAALSAVD